MLPSLSLSSSPNSATVKVDKATSELLMAPDWTMNMEICDSVNSDNWNSKEVVKAVKKRLQHKNPRVQMLTLTLLETMVKNCGDSIHFHIAERKILDEMIKIVKKRTDLQVRGKVLVLIDSWQEAFGGPGGKHTQYYWAYDELRRSGVQFPPRSLDTAPIITPPATQLSMRNAQVRLGMPSNSSRTLDDAMASDVENLSASGMETIRNAMELLADMLQAANPSDRMSVKDEVIVDLVDRCHANQRRLMQMLATTMDEELLGQGLELNDALQVLLAKHDAIASGSPLPAQLTSTASSHPNESPSNLKPSESRPADSGSITIAKPSTLSGNTTKAHAVEEEEADDEFALLARRHSKLSPVPAKNEDVASSSSSNSTTFSASTTPESTLSNALVPVDPPATVKTTKEQDMVDFLSIVLSTSFTSEAEPSPQTPKSAPAENYSGNHVQPTFSSYVVPWAQAPPQSQPQTQIHQQSQFDSAPRTHQQQTHFLPQQSSPVQPSYPQLSSAYPPPPWAPTPGYATGRVQSYPYQNQQPLNTGVQTLHHSAPFQNPQSANQLGNSALQPTIDSSPTATGAPSLHHMSSMPAREVSGGGSSSLAINGSTATSSPGGQKPYIPSYRLFEDLNVFGNMEGKIRSGPYSSSSGSSSQSMVGGRR